MKNKIIIVTADPNSINSEIIFKTWKRLKKSEKKNIFLIGNYELIRKQFKKLKVKLKLLKLKNFIEQNSHNCLKIIDIPLNFKDPFKVSLNESSKYLVKSLKLANELANGKHVKGIINCPIDKKLLKKTNKVGVTEYFASMCNIRDKSEIMMIYNKSFSVVPITTHINVKDVSKIISKKFIIRKILSLDKNFKKLFKIKPKIGILGLNPHNGELKKNSEEVKKIIPAISNLKKRGVNIQGPIVTDTSFIANYKKFSVLVGMYHDQVLTPFKTLFKYKAINLTLGLPYIRVSPDHGPAFNLIGKNKGNFQSLLECVRFINKK